MSLKPSTRSLIRHGRLNKVMGQQARKISADAFKMARKVNSKGLRSNIIEDFDRRGR